MERVGKARKQELAEVFFIECAIIVLEMIQAALTLLLAIEILKELEEEERRRRNGQG